MHSRNKVASVSVLCIHVCNYASRIEVEYIIVLARLTLLSQLFWKHGLSITSFMSTGQHLNINTYYQKVRDRMSVAKLHFSVCKRDIIMRPQGVRLYRLRWPWGVKAQAKTHRGRSAQNRCSTWIPIQSQRADTPGSFINCNNCGKMETLFGFKLYMAKQELEH